MNTVLPSKIVLVSALLAAVLIFLSLSFPFRAELFVGYATVFALLALARLEYTSPRSYRDGK